MAEGWNKWEEWEEVRNTKLLVSREQKELFRWSKKHFS